MVQLNTNGRNNPTVLQLNNPTVTNSTPQAETNIEREIKKPSSKRIEHKRNWNVGIPQLNHVAYISIYIDVRKGRKEGRQRGCR